MSFILFLFLLILISPVALQLSASPNGKSGIKIKSKSMIKDEAARVLAIFMTVPLSHCQF
jgi:hypothetical protein